MATEPQLDQTRWNRLGSERLRALREEPERFVSEASPHAGQLCHAELALLLEPLPGRRILELGCGRGEFSAWLARGGARVAGLDVGPDLVAAARLAAQVNGGDACFAVADAARVPFADASFDVVVGMNVLHHLSRPALARAVREAYRLLAPGGLAIFYEPVENSRVLGLLRDAVPAPATRKGRAGRPSILQRRAWRAYQAELDDRSLTTREIRRAAVSFAEVQARGYGVLVRLKRFVGKARSKQLPELDARMLAAVPFLERFGRHVLVVCRKAPATAA